jgi:plasmid stability protein
MGVLVQVRDLPVSAHRALKARAATEGRTLSAYLRRELIALAERPSPDELWERISAREVVNPRQTPSDTIRAERDTG